MFEGDLDPDESKPLPPELMVQRPRKIRLTLTGWLYASMATFIFALGAAAVVKVVQSVHKQRATQIVLRQSGGQSLGHVTRKWIAGFGGGHLSYSFGVDGTVYAGETTPPIEIWDSLHQGDALLVRYLPATPDISHPAAWEDSTSSAWWALIIPGWLVFFSSLFVWRFPSQYRVAIGGIPAWARIAEREWRGPKGSHWESYTFRNADGEVEFGRCPMDVNLKAGSTVCVLYLPAKPSRSIIYPLDFYEIK